MSNILEFHNVCAGYGDLKVLYDVSFEVGEGQVVSLVGSNGAGKTTLLRIISGLEPVTAGSVIFCGEDLLKYKTYERAELGIAHIPQGRGILNSLTVKENLVLGAYNKRARANFEKNLEKVYDMFPILKERENQTAGELSGGQQQMLAVSRALVMEPKLIMMDEPSLGLSPLLASEVFKIITTLVKQRLSILLVEQNLQKALKIAERGYVLETGKVVMLGPGKELLANKDITSAYLGI